MIPQEQQQRLVKSDSGISRKQLNQQQALQQRQAAQLSQQSQVGTFPRQNGIQFNGMNQETDQKQLQSEENNFQQLRPTSSREQQQYPQMKQQYQQRFPQIGVQETSEEAYKRSNNDARQHEQIHEDKPDDTSQGINRSQGFQQECGDYSNGNKIDNNSLMMNSSQIPIKEEQEQEQDGNTNENNNNNTNNTIENTINEGLMELKVGFISSGLKKMEWGLQRCLLERSSDGEFRELFSVVVSSCNEVALELLTWNESSSALRLLQRCYIWTQSSSDFGYFPELRALTLNSLGCVYLRLSQLQESLSLFQEAQKIQQQATVAMTLTNLAAVSCRLGKHKKALEFARYALMESQHEFMISKDPQQENNSNISNNYSNTSSKSRLSKLTQLVRSYLNAGIGEEMAGSVESALRHFENAVSAAEEFLPADNQILQHVRQQFAGFSARYAHFKVHGGAGNQTQNANNNHESVLTPQMLSATDSIGENNINSNQYFPHTQAVRNHNVAKDESAKSSKLKKRPKKLKKKEKKAIISPYSQQLGFNYSNISGNINNNSEYPLQVNASSISQLARQQELLQYQQQGYPGEQYQKANPVTINEQSQLVPHSRNSSNISLSLRRPLSAAPYSNYYVSQQQQQQQQEAYQYQSSFSHPHIQPLVINDFNSSAPSSSHNPKSAATTRSKRVFSPLSGKVKTKPAITPSTPQSQPYAVNHQLNSMAIRKTSTIPVNNSSTPLSSSAATNSRTTPFLSYKNKQTPFAFQGAATTASIDENPLYNVNSASRTSLLKSLKKQYSRVASNMESIERQLLQQELSRSTAASTQPAFQFHDYSSGNNNHFHKTSNLSGSISEQIPQGGTTTTTDQGQLSEYFKGASLPRQQVKPKQRPAVISAVPGAASVYESLMQNKKSDRPFLIRNSKISQIAGGNNGVYLPMSMSQLSYAGSPHNVENNGNNTSMGRNGRVEQQQQMYFRSQTSQNNQNDRQQQQIYTKGGKNYLNSNNSKTSYDLQLGQDTAEQGQEYNNLKEVTYPDFQMGQSWKSTQNMINAYSPSALPFNADILQENQLIQLNEVVPQAQNTIPLIDRTTQSQEQPGIPKTQGQFGSLRFLLIESGLTVSIVFKPERNPNALLIHSVNVSDVMNSKERSEGRQLLVEFCAEITSKIYVNNVANCLSIVLPVVKSKGDGGMIGGSWIGSQQNNPNSNDRFMQQQIQLQRIHRCLDIVLKNQSESILLVAENSFNHSEGIRSHGSQKIKDYMEFYEEEQQPVRTQQQLIGKQQQQQKNLQMGEQFVEEYEDDDHGAIRPLLNTVLMDKSNGKDDEELITPIMLDTAQLKALNNSIHKGQQNRRSLYQGEQIAEVEEADTLNNQNNQQGNPGGRRNNQDNISEDEDIIEDFEYDEDDDKFEQDLERAVQQTNNKKDNRMGYKNNEEQQQAEKYKKKNITAANKGNSSNKHKPQSSKVPKTSGKQQNLKIERARSAYHKKLDEDGSGEDDNDDDQGAGESKYGFASRVSSKSRQRQGDDKSESINQNDHRVLGLQEIESQLDIAQDDDRFFSQQKQVSAHFPFDDELGGSSVPHHHEEQDQEHEDYFGNNGGSQNQSLKHLVGEGDVHGSTNQKNPKSKSNGTGGIGAQSSKGGQFVGPFEKGSKDKGKGERNGEDRVKEDEKNSNNVNFQTFSNFNDITKNSSKHELASLKDLPKIPSISSNNNKSNNSQSIPGNNSSDNHQTSTPGMPPPFAETATSQKLHEDDEAMGLMKKTVSRRNTPPPKIVINNGFDNEDPFVAYDNAQAQKKSEADEAKEEFDKLIAEKGQQPLNSAAIFIQRKYKHKKKVEGENSNKNTKDGSDNLQPFSTSSDKQKALNSVLTASISKNPINSDGNKKMNNGGNTAEKTKEEQPEDPPIDINDGNRHEFEKAASLIGMRYKQRKLNLASKDTNNNNITSNPLKLDSPKEQKKQENVAKPSGKEPETEEVKLDGPLEEYAAVANKIGAAYKLKKQREQQKKDEQTQQKQQQQQQQQPKQEEEKVVLDGPLEEYAAVANKIGAAYKLKKQREQQKKDEQQGQLQQKSQPTSKNVKIDVNSQDYQSSLQDTPVRIIDGGKPRKQQTVEERTEKTTEQEDQGGEGQKKKQQVQAEFNLSRRFKQQVEFII